MKINKRRPPANFSAGPDGMGQDPDSLFGVADQADPAPGFRTLDTPDPRLAAVELEPRRGHIAMQGHAAHAPVVQPDDTVQHNHWPAPGSGLPIYGIAAAVFALWACAPIAFALGARSGIAPFDDNGFALAVFALLVIGPGALIFIAAYLIRQGQKLAAEARRAKVMSDELISPALLAAGRASDVVRTVRAEIAHAGEAADDARETLIALRDALAAETDTLSGAAAAATRNAQGLIEALGRERAEMDTMAQNLDVQAVRVADTITQQARMVAEASDLAETQLREAEALLAARAADLAAAAGDVSDAARTAGEDLTRHIARLETAGVGVAQQINAVEMGLTEQRAALFNVAQALKGEHESFAAEAESHAAKLGEFISQARLSAVEMSDRAIKGGEALRDLVASAGDQMRELARSVQNERQAFGDSTVESIGAVSTAAAKERAMLEEQTRAAIDALARAAEETRAAAAQHAETARLQVDQLSEAAFSAGQQANQIFEARLAEARELIDHSAKMVEQAGGTTARKLEEGASAARATLLELQEMMAAIEAKAKDLPLAARGQAEQVRNAVADSMEELMEQARRTAEETEAIDAAFQSRVRRNYEMLSEAVRLMGAVGSVVETPPPREPSFRERLRRGRSETKETSIVEQTPNVQPNTELTGPVEPPTVAPALEAELRPQEPVEAPNPEAESDAGAPAAVDAIEAALPPDPEPAPNADLDIDDLLEPPSSVDRPAPQFKATASGMALRPRLRLTPTATDEEFSSVFSSAAGRPPEARAEDGWTWKELLTSIDEADGDGNALEGRMIAEISDMGIDPAALLPKARVEEIAAAVQTGDKVGAREVVRRLAPAATRRIARRLSGDAKLKAQVDVYLDRYETLLREATEGDHAGLLAEALLCSEGGRAFLLLDAALSD